MEIQTPSQNNQLRYVNTVRWESSEIGVPTQPEEIDDRKSAEVIKFVSSVERYDTLDSGARYVALWAYCYIFYSSFATAEQNAKELHRKQVLVHKTYMDCSELFI